MTVRFVDSETSLSDSSAIADSDSPAKRAGVALRPWDYESGGDSETFVQGIGAHWVDVAVDRPDLKQNRSRLAELGRATRSKRVRVRGNSVRELSQFGYATFNTENFAQTIVVDVDDHSPGALGLDGWEPITDEEWQRIRYDEDGAQYLKQRIKTRRRMSLAEKQAELEARFASWPVRPNYVLINGRRSRWSFQLIWLIDKKVFATGRRRELLDEIRSALTDFIGGDTNFQHHSMSRNPLCRTIGWGLTSPADDEMIEMHSYRAFVIDHTPHSLHALNFHHLPERLDEYAEHHQDVIEHDIRLATAGPGDLYMPSGRKRRKEPEITYDSEGLQRKWYLSQALFDYAGSQMWIGQPVTMETLFPVALEIAAEISKVDDRAPLSAGEARGKCKAILKYIRKHGWKPGAGLRRGDEARRVIPKFAAEQSRKGGQVRAQQLVSDGTWDNEIRPRGPEERHRKAVESDLYRDIQMAWLEEKKVKPKPNVTKLAERFEVTRPTIYNALDAAGLRSKTSQPESESEPERVQRTMATSETHDETPMKPEPTSNSFSDETRSESLTGMCSR